jgi:hypothetical protein
MKTAMKPMISVIPACAGMTEIIGFGAERPMFLSETGIG